jgi:hypothetical protein
MRRIFFIVLILIAVCGFVAYGVRSYIVADWRLAPEPTVAVSLRLASEPQTAVMEKPLAPTEAEWRVPLLKGLIHKALSRRDAAAEEALGPIGEAPLDLSLTLPQDFAHRVRLSRDGALVSTSGLPRGKSLRSKPAHIRSRSTVPYPRRRGRPRATASFAIAAASRSSRNPIRNS